MYVSVSFSCTRDTPPAPEDSSLGFTAFTLAPVNPPMSVASIVTVFTPADHVPLEGGFSSTVSVRPLSVGPVRVSERGVAEDVSWVGERVISVV